MIRDLPKGASYPAIKKALMSTFERTQLEKDTELLNMLTLGDCDPRSAIRELQALNGDPATLLRAVVINMLPQDVRVALSNMKADCTLEEIDERAYKILNLRKERKKINAIKRRPARETDSKDEEDEVNAVQARTWKGSKDKDRKPRRGGGKEREEFFVCFAHKKFGLKAFTCKQGCAFADAPLAQRGAGNGPAGR